MEKGGGRLNRLLLGVSGSVSILNLPSYLATLRATLAKEIWMIMTPAAASMMTPSTLALLCDEVFLDSDSPYEKKPGHVELTRWCDMFVVLPASANLLGLAANGIAPNLLTTAVLASPKPVTFCPNMNDTMWSKAAVQRNVETLRRDGHVVVDPKLTLAYEVNSKKMEEGWVIPDPEQMVGLLREIHQGLDPFVLRETKGPVEDQSYQAKNDGEGHISLLQT